MKYYNVAIIGASGAVGEEIISLLEFSKFPISALALFGSANSALSEVNALGETLIIQELNESSFANPKLTPIKKSLDSKNKGKNELNSIDIAFFAASSVISQKFIPLALKENIFVIDNSSFFRMQHEVPLVVPEVNSEKITNKATLISNPNCSTIQMVQVLNPLHKHNPIKRVNVSTYQAVSGGGKRAMESLIRELEAFFNFRLGEVEPAVFPHQIALNLIPHIDKFLESGFTKEEVKMIQETHKIMDVDFPISATCVRVPILRSHSESISIEFENEISAKNALEILKNAPNIKLIDQPDDNLYPMPILASDTDFTYVGRIREDIFDKRILHLFCVADQLRVGAATNAVKIAEKYIEKKALSL